MLIFQLEHILKPNWQNFEPELMIKRRNYGSVFGDNKDVAKFQIFLARSSKTRDKNIPFEI